MDLLSGRGGLASFLRRRQLGARLGGPSLPLDVGYSQTIPAGIRNAVILRDKHCQWAGRCHQPASACEVHHVRHKKDGARPASRTAYSFAPSNRDPPVGLDPSAEPGRHHDRLEQGQDKGPAQPQPTRPARITPRGGAGSDRAAVLQVGHPPAASGRSNPPPDRAPEQGERIRQRDQPGFGDLLGLQRQAGQRLVAHLPAVE